MTTNPPRTTRKAPWLHQFLVYVFTGLFTLLAYWLLRIWAEAPAKKA